MKKIILILFAVILFWNDSSSQIDSVSIQGIDCYNDTAFIKINLSNSAYILESDEWQYQPYNDTSWYFLDTNLYIINPTNDTLFSNQCGKHKVAVFDQTSFEFIEYTFFIPCPVTVGLGQKEKIKCFGDSSGILIAPTYGGIIFDPDSITVDSLGFYSPNELLILRNVVDRAYSLMFHQGLLRPIGGYFRQYFPLNQCCYNNHM